MQDVSVQIDIEDSRWEQAISNIYDVVDVVKSAVFSYVYEHENLDIFNCKKSLVVNLCLSNDSHVQKLNRDFRHMDKPTNVLSFANLDLENFDWQNEPFAEIELGDIIIAYETMVKEAEAEGISLYAHFCHLLVHGILHILGFDHIEEDEAVYMENCEKEILKTMGITNPYE